MSEGRTGHGHIKDILMKQAISKIYQHVINPPSDEALSKAWQQSGEALPTLWLLGKTGAGKSSIVNQLTDDPRAEIGSGFMPCTQGSSYYDYPEQRPILRFLDTRGLGEADYDPSEDIATLGKSSHALLVVLRIKDAVQEPIMSALQRIRKSAQHIPGSAVMVVHTGLDEVPDEHERQRAINLKQEAVEAIWGCTLDSCSVNFSEHPDGDGLHDQGAEELRDMIRAKLPELQLWLQKRGQQDAEQANFDLLSSDVIWYTRTAAASDAIPVVGLVSVPAIQGKMLHSLAQKYGIEWNKRNFSEFTAALGSSFAIRYAVSLLGRQLTKLIPAYGQIAGAALSVSISYAGTYALGRAACKYLYYKKTGQPVDEDALQSTYTEAMEEGKQASEEHTAKAEEQQQ